MAQLQASQAPSLAVPGGAGWDCHVHVFDASAPVQGGHYQPAHQPLERIERDTERDFFMSAMEAKEYGLIDEVVVHNQKKADKK